MGCWLPRAARALLLVALASCATTDVDPRATPKPEPGELFWTSLSATYRGRMTAEGDDQVIQAGLVLGADVCDKELLDASKVCSRPEAAAGAQREIRCRMQCRAHVAQPGPTLVRATLFVAGHPVALQLDRVELSGKP